MRRTIHDLRQLAATRKLASLTCYDASFAGVLDDAGIDILLVGDSLGMVIQGHASTLPVTVADVAYHTRAVARGVRTAWIVADMPFGSYQASPEQALGNAVELMQAGADMVKLEGGEEMAATVAFLVARGVPVCGHVGLTPQHVQTLGGYRIQGKDAAGAERVLAGARAIEEAGAAMLVVEAVPHSLAERIVARRQSLVIGIGASAACDGQVLVLHDMLGITPGKRPRFVKDFLADGGSVEAAVRRYVDAVRIGAFPGPEHVYPDEA
ncbi:3-methyl-2-oxobutanoate hydroxymethyltransferase [Burkholderiales bacterium GJ-E10]|nr:3-methyl-2-oxobutanoate hydroxymethyltransferase [Burkholderiales bacterium GJ-E10]